MMKPPSTPAVIELEADCLVPASYSEFLESRGFEYLDQELRPGWVLASFRATLSHAQFIALISKSGDLSEIGPAEEDSQEEVASKVAADLKAGVKKRKLHPSPASSSDEEEKEEEISID